MWHPRSTKLKSLGPASAAMAVNREPTPPQNTVLAALERKCSGAMQKHRAEATLQRGDILTEPGQPIQLVYFPP
jgi:hypothetical protein